MMPNKPTNQIPEVAFDLSDLFVFLWQKKIRIIITALVLLVLGGSYIVKLPKFYTASSTILLGGEKQGLSLPAGMAKFAGKDDGLINTYMEFMRSKQFAEKVILELDLHKSREFQPAVPFGTSIEQLQHSIRFFQKNLSLLPIADTDLLKVSFVSASPQQASRVVNHIGPAFFIFYAEKAKKKAGDTSDWLNNQLQVLETKLAEADDSLQAFMQKHSLVDISSQAELARTEMSALLTEKLYNEKALAQIKTVYQHVQSFDKDYASLMKNAYFLQNPLVTNIRSKIISQQQNIDELSKRYKFKHHKYIAADAVLKGLQQELANLLDNLIANVQQEYNSLISRRDVLLQQIAMIKAEYGELGKHELQLKRLRREVESTQKLYELFLAKLQETEILKDLGSVEDFAVVDFADDPRVPSKPKVKILLAVLAIFSGFISISFWLVLHLVSDKKTRFMTLLNKLQVPMLGQIPKYKKSKLKKGQVEANYKGKNYQYSEAVRSLRAEISVRSDASKIRTVVLARVKESNLKSSLAIDLAESFAQLEKSIIVDADMRQPQVGPAYEMEKLTPGLSNFISRRTSFSDSTYKEAGSQLSVMPSGAIPADPLLYISKSRFSSFIKKLGVLFEHVIIVAPAVNLYSDTMIISKAVDGVILLCDLEITDGADLMEAIQRLQDSKAPLIGVVFENAKNVKSNYPKNKSLLARLFGH